MGKLQQHFGVYFLHVQGTAKEPGILPRVLDTTFRHIRQRQYTGMDLKPYLGSDAQCLGPEQVKQEKTARASIFASFREATVLFMQY